MPELPEVEFAKRALARAMKGAVVRSFSTDARILDGTLARARRLLIGRTVGPIERRGKWIRVSLGDHRLFSHLGMTGKWKRADEGDALRFERMRIDLERNGKPRSVRYVDPRLFGRVVVARTDIPEWSALGPDPLHDGIEVDALFDELQRKKAAIKPTLLDQALIAGLGNIQVTEALYFGKIDPRRPARSLSKEEVAALVTAIHRTLERTLGLEDGPEITYVEEAGAENPFVIYARGGEPCPSCSTPLCRMVLGGRGTVYCGTCQK